MIKANLSNIQLHRKSLNLTKPQVNQNHENAREKIIIINNLKVAKSKEGRYEHMHACMHAHTLISPF